MPKNITVYISDELIERMKKAPETNWSEVCRRGIENFLEKRIETTEEWAKALETVLAELKSLEIRMQNYELELQFIKKTVIGDKNGRN